MALEDSRHNLENIELEFVIQDSKCKSVDGVNAINQLLFEDVKAIIGITCSDVAEAVAPIIEENKIPTILSVAASYEPRGGSIFKLWPSNKERARFEAGFIEEELKFDKLGVIYANNAFGLGLKNDFEKEFRGKLFIESYNPEDKDFRPQLTKLKNANPQGIFIIAYEPSAVNILKQAKELGMNQQFIGLSSLLSEGFLKSAGELGEGLIIDLPTTQSELTPDFEKRFFNKYHDPIIHSGGYFAYDSVIILADILDETQDREAIRNKLYEINTIGVSGVIDFDSYGRNREKSEFELVIVQNGKFVPVD